MLVFRIKNSDVLSAFEIDMLNAIADKIREGVLPLYRLNPVKVAKYGIERTLKLLEDLNVYVPEDVQRVIREIARDSIDVYIDFDELGLILYTHDVNFIDILKAKNLAYYDEEKGLWRSLPKDLNIVLDVAYMKRYKCRTSFTIDYSLGIELKPKVTLRDYQEEAYRKWRENNCRGVVALPVAAGKTYIALKAIEDLKMKTLVLVPTIDLLHQWRDNMAKFLGIPRDAIAVYGGGSRDIGDITVMTYDSASINLHKYFNIFGLIVLDECHHAVSQSYRNALVMSTAPCRLGLTATPFRSDGLHKYYEYIIGPIVYFIEKDVLQSRGYLASHREERIYVELSREELEMYKKYVRRYLDFCEKRLPNVKDPKKRFQIVLRMAGRDPEAREALRAKHRARRIALSTDKKIKVVEELLNKYRDEKILIFSRYTDIVRKISRLFLIPRILHDTPEDERKKYLDMFRRGEIRILATAMALDEGVDVPDASVAIVVSGTGSYREYIQRLGRILRPKDREAVLIEIITKRTDELSLAKRRRKFEIFNEDEAR
ncbi:MAG: DEAD/DEAH box helicase [Ignisphaera sp.]